MKLIGFPGNQLQRYLSPFRLWEHRQHECYYIHSACLLHDRCNCQPDYGASSGTYTYTDSEADPSLTLGNGVLMQAISLGSALDFGATGATVP